MLSSNPSLPQPIPSPQNKSLGDDLYLNNEPENEVVFLNILLHLILQLLLQTLLPQVFVLLLKLKLLRQ